MTVAHVGPPPPPSRGRGLGRPIELATRGLFLVAGFGTAAWAPLVPFAKANAGLTDGGLGLLLLCMGAGSIAAMPLAGTLAARFGCRTVLLPSAVLMCLALPVMATAVAVPVLGLALLVFGAGLGSFDCVMNVQAIIVERAARRPMMSGFHGMFSLGAILGAGVVSLLLSAGASPAAATLCVVAGIAVALLAGRPHLLRFGAAGGGGGFRRPRGIVLLLGTLCAVLFLAEGSVLDWSAVFLTSVRGARPADAGLGYAAFALTMTVGRLTGDAVVRRIGGVRVTAWGGLFAAAGLAVVVLTPVWWVDVAAYALVGVGCSNIVPVMYTAIGRQTVMPEHAAIPALTTLGYAGILAGPALIGLLARATGLSAALLVVAAMLLGVAASARVLKTYVP